MDLKVVLIAPQFSPKMGGLGTYCWGLAKYLREVELHVLAASPPESPLKENNEVQIHLISNPKDNFLYNASFQIRTLKALRELQKEFKPDIIHTQHMSDLFYELIPNMPSLVTTLHTTIYGQIKGIQTSKVPFHRLERSEKWQIVLQSSLLTAERARLKNCSDYYITVSRWMKQEIQLEYPAISRRIGVIHNGVDPEIYRPQVDSNYTEAKGPIILFLSRLTAAKGIHILIKAIPLILKQYPRSMFLFAGPGPSDQWSQLLQANKIPRNRFRFLGVIPQEQMPELYSAADIYVAPTLYDNFPFRVLEAMSCGKPVVTSRIGGIPEVITDGKNGLLTEPGDHIELSQAITGLLDDSTLSRRIGRRARQTVKQNFTWRRVAGKTLEVYTHVLERN